MAWNPHEKTWDCPCHGSFYDCKGRIVQVPAATVDSFKNGQTSHVLPQTEPACAVVLLSQPIIAVVQGPAATDLKSLDW